MKRYYENKGITIYHGDCRDILHAVNRVDSVITSPPYNLNVRVNRKREYISRQVIPEEFSTKYQSYPDNLAPVEYENMTCEVLSQCVRMAGMVFWNVQLVTGNKPALCNLIGRFSRYLKEIAIWDKGSGQPAMQTRTMNSSFEFMLMFSKGDPTTRQFEAATFNRGTLSNIWRISPYREAKEHRATFPTELVATRLSIHRSQSVLDPFMGTGTVLRVAQEMGIAALGIELDERYCEIAANKLSKRS